MIAHDRDRALGVAVRCYSIFCARDPRKIESCSFALKPTHRTYRASGFQVSCQVCPTTSTRECRRR